jgi:hypothetical protein
MSLAMRCPLLFDSGRADSGRADSGRALAPEEMRAPVRRRERLGPLSSPMAL